MAEKTQRKVRAHTRYYLADGTYVPGVTTVLNLLNKPALVGWANRMGLQGIDTNKYVDSKAEVGTCAHYMIECELKKEKPDLSEYSPATVDAAENSYLKFIDWMSNKEFKLLGSEKQLVSEKYRYGGTVDVYCSLMGEKTLLDIKTSGSGIWPEMRHQVAAYRQLLLEEGNDVDQVMIIRVGRDDSEGFETEKIGKLDLHFELFKHLLEIYRIQKELK
jgi:hypothetical protein